MSLTRRQARNEILTAIKSVLDTLTTDLPADQVIYRNKSTAQIPDTDTPSPTYWAVVLVQHAAGAQASLTGRVDERLYEKSGLVTVQLFAPRGKMLEADDIVETIESAFLGVSTPGGVWYRNVRSTEIGESGPWFQTNILAEFTYDQVR